MTKVEYICIVQYANHHIESCKNCVWLTFPLHTNVACFTVIQCSQFILKAEAPETFLLLHHCPAVFSFTHIIHRFYTISPSLSYSYYLLYTSRCCNKLNGFSTRKTIPWSLLKINYKLGIRLSDIFRGFFPRWECLQLNWLHQKLSE